jgi:hypothetical protein
VHDRSPDIRDADRPVVDQSQFVVNVVDAS